MVCAVLTALPVVPPVPEPFPVPVVPPPVVPPLNPPVVVESSLPQPAKANTAPTNTTPDIFLMLLITFTLKIIKTGQFAVHGTTELVALEIADADMINRIIGATRGAIQVAHPFYIQAAAGVGVEVEAQPEAGAVIRNG